MSRFGMLPQNSSCELVHILAELQRGEGRADSAYNWHQNPMTLDAANDADHSVASVLHGTKVSIEDFLDMCVVQHFQFAHDGAPDLLARIAIGTNLQRGIAHTQENSSSTRKPAGIPATVAVNSRQFVAVPCEGTIA